MSDAAVDVFADAFEDDPIQRAVAAAMMQLAAQVRVLNQSADPDFHDTVSRAGILALIEIFRYRISRKAVAHIVSSYRSDLADEVRGLPRDRENAERDTIARWEVLRLLDMAP